MMSSEHDLADELDVGLFPLPSVVLFPGMMLPLLVFEPRYRALVADALEGNRLIALPRLVPGHEAEYLDCPPISRTFGVGRIVDDVQLPDGRYRIVVKGTSRVELVTELRQEPYRYARVRSILPDTSQPTPSTLTLRANLLSLVEKLARQVEAGDRLLQAARSAPTPTACADLIAASLVSDDALRQQLMEEPSVLIRLELLLGHLYGMLWRVEPRATGNALN